MTHQLSIGRILKRDWPSFCCSVFISLWWLIVIAAYLLVAVWYPEDRDGWLLAHLMGVGGLGLTALLGAVIVRRIHIIRRVFGRGEAVRGEILSVGENAEDIGYAVVAYQYQGRQYLVRNVTEGAVGREGLTPGAPVDIVLDPSKPSRAFISKLYLE
jgi:hypothetical protein